MITKALSIYFIVLTVTQISLMGLITWKGTDTEFKHYTAIRMHACDILENDHSTLPEFNPDRCEVSRRPLLVGEIIDVTCNAANNEGKQHQFSYSYSAVHHVFDYYFKHYFPASRGGYCNG